jgi:site-specific DNA-methyltransferase (adenine-specific)
MVESGINLYHGDCLELMKDIPDKSIDMILCDLPYGTTACKWDIIISLESLCEQYKRVIKNNSAIVLTAREPFTSKLIMSNIKSYKHKWIWNKKQTGSFANAKYMPLQIEEDIVVFCNDKVKYYPIMRKGKFRKKGGSKKQIQSMSKFIKPEYYKYSDDYYPTNILEYPNCSNKSKNLHPTQKPVALLEYLIKTYSNENELILDNCMGSGSTGIACKNLNRSFIGIELDKNYFDIAKNRIEAQLI